MEIENSTNYRLIEGQEKQSLLEKYINQPADLDRSTANIEILQIATKTIQIPKQKLVRLTKPIFDKEELENNISSLSQFISQSKTGKSEQVQYYIRSEKEFSRENLAEIIRSIN